MNFGDPRLPQRYWDKVTVDSETGCWLWTACITTQGYPQLRWKLNGHWKVVDAARLATGVANGADRPITQDEVEALLRCEHARHCCNPAHAVEGTVVDIGARRRQTHCHLGHRLGGDNTYPYSERAYKECRRRINREWQAKRRAGLKAAGRCGRCGGKKARGRLQCERCLEIGREWHRRQQEARAR